MPSFQADFGPDDSTLRRQTSLDEFDAPSDADTADATDATPTETTDATAPDDQAAAEPDAPAWTPGTNTNKRECENCGAHLSANYRRVWSETGDGRVAFCRECVPRSVRFGEDHRGRDPEDIEDFDVTAHNA